MLWEKLKFKPFQKEQMTLLIFKYILLIGWSLILYTNSEIMFTVNNIFIIFCVILSLLIIIQISLIKIRDYKIFMIIFLILLLGTALVLEIQLVLEIIVDEIYVLHTRPDLVEAFGNFFQQLINGDIWRILMDKQYVSKKAHYATIQLWILLIFFTYIAAIGVFILIFTTLKDMYLIKNYYENTEQK